MRGVDPSCNANCWVIAHGGVSTRLPRSSQPQDALTGTDAVSPTAAPPLATASAAVPVTGSDAEEEADAGAGVRRRRGASRRSSAPPARVHLLLIPRTRLRLRHQLPAHVDDSIGAADADAELGMARASVSAA